MDCLNSQGLEFQDAHHIVQGFESDLPVGLAEVDCDGDEASLLDCTFNRFEIQRCGISGTNMTEATVLACANSASGGPFPPA